MKTKSTKTKIYLLFMIITMVVIFVFSSQPAEASMQLSDGMLEDIMDGWGRGLPGFIADFISNYIRKMAHFFIYMLLGVFSFHTVYNWMERPEAKKIPLQYGFLICVVYAITDELHQRFVPGRSCEWNDVCLDATGAIVGIGIVVIFLFIKNILFNRKKI